MRLFAGVFPTPEALERIMAVQGELRTRIRSRASWTEPETMHFTLRFFGNDANEERAIEAVDRAVAGRCTFHIDVGGIGGFPNARRARVGFLEPESKELFEIANAMKAEEDREPHPHLTFARFREPAGIPAVQFEPISFVATRVALVQSVLGGPDKGYRLLREWVLLDEAV